MTMRQFLKDYREQIDSQINSVRFRHDGNGGRGTIPSPPPRYTNADREEWVKNDEPLYRLAQRAGVRV